MIQRAVFNGFRRINPCRTSLPSVKFNRASLLLQSSASKLATDRSYVTKSNADEKIEDLQELYATAKDEFEIASEETEKKTVYAADDRAAAHEELDRFKAAFEEAIKGEGGEEIKKRIGQRVRELDNAVKAMDDIAMED